MSKLTNVKELNELREKLRQDTFKPDALRARVCCGTACTATGAHKVIESFEKERKDRLSGDMSKRPGP
jgi:NADH:ubiquinone oxidoreductase subunit E